MFIFSESNYETCIEVTAFANLPRRQAEAYSEKNIYFL